MSDTTEAREALDQLCPEDSLFVQWEGYDPRKTILAALDSHDAFAKEVEKLRRTVDSLRIDLANQESKSQTAQLAVLARLAEWEALRDDIRSNAQIVFNSERVAVLYTERAARILAHLNREADRG